MVIVSWKPPYCCRGCQSLLTQHVHSDTLCILIFKKILPDTQNMMEKQSLCMSQQAQCCMTCMQSGKSMLIISLLRLNCFGARLPSSIGSVQLQNNICKHFYTEGLHHPSSLHLFNSRQVLNIYSTLLSHPSDAVCVLQMFSSLVPPEILNPCVCFLCVCVCVSDIRVMWAQTTLSSLGTDMLLWKKKKKSHISAGCQTFFL